MQQTTFRISDIDTRSVDVSLDPIPFGRHDRFPGDAASWSDPSQVFRRVQELVRDYLLATHPATGEQPERVAEIRKRYEKLVQDIKLLLGTDLKFDSEGKALLFGLRLDLEQFYGRDRVSSHLSSGQIRLLQPCITMFQNETVEDETVFFADEPELFMHPADLIDTFERLQRVFINSQVFLATHSLPLLAHIGARHIWYVNSGEVSYAGKNTGLVLTGLCGGDRNIEALASFLQEPASLALTQFATECLVGPSTVAAVPGDPQQSQVSAFVTDQAARLGRSVRALDWGAGQGRIAWALSEIFKTTTIKESIEYYAYDNEAKDAERCRAAIRALHGSDDKRYFNEPSTLFARAGEHSFDLVVLCNVLHELEPTDWLRTFADLRKLLTADGTLLILEDLQVPYGESAFDEGFILLPREAVAKLFSISLSEVGYSTPNGTKYQDRLVAYWLRASDLKLTTPASIKDALTLVRDQAERKLRELRTKHEHRRFDFGHKHALYLVQFANSSLCLRAYEQSN